MIKLTQQQTAVLASADTHPNGFSIRPATLKPATAAKVAAKLLEHGLVREVRGKGDVPIWREDEHGKAFSLKILKAGRLAVQAIVQPSAEDHGRAPTGQVRQSDRGTTSKAQRRSMATDASAAKPGSKRAAILALLSREDGATIQTLMNATGWLPHMTRAALTGLRKGGFAITRRRDADADASVYRIEPAMVAAAS